MIKIAEKIRDRRECSFIVHQRIQQIEPLFIVLNRYLLFEQINTMAGIQQDIQQCFKNP